MSSVSISSICLTAVIFFANLNDVWGFHFHYFQSTPTPTPTINRSRSRSTKCIIRAPSNVSPHPSRYSTQQKHRNCRVGPLQLAPASDYERDDFVNDRHFRDRGQYSGDFTARPSRPNGGGGAGAGRMDNNRGPHMDVTTSNPHFMRTDRPRSEAYRGGSRGVRPDIQDLNRRGGRDRMPMQDEQWNRYRYSRERPSQFRSNGRGGRRRNGSMPHFIADDADVGMPVDGPPPPPMDELEEEEMMENESRAFRGGVRRGESMREREWRELDERRARRGARMFPQEYGPMPMRGGFDEWGGMDGMDGMSGMDGGEFYPPFPQEGGRYGRRYADRESYFGDDRDGDMFGRMGRGGGGPRDYFSEGRGMGGDFARRGMGGMDFEDEYSYEREGPRSRFGNNRMNRPRRGPSAREEEDYMYDENEMDGDRDRFFPRRSRGVYSGSVRDEPGSMGGPMQQDLFGRDSQYTSKQSGWTTGTSFDTI